MYILLVFLIFITGYIITQLQLSMKRPINFPPGPKFMPWFGNILQVRKESALLGGQHKVYEKWAKRYKSNILGLKFGKDLVVVALDYSSVREILLSKDFEGRPDTFFFRLRSMGTRKGITFTDGPLWHEQRQFALKQLHNVGFGRTVMEKHIQKEVTDLIGHLKQFNGEGSYPSSIIAQAVVNILWTIVAGKRFEKDDERLLKLLNLLACRSKAFDMAGGIISQFPWLRFIAPTSTGYTLICQLNAELSDFFSKTIEQHKKNLTENNNSGDLNDFIQAYLEEMKMHDSKNSTFNETQLTMVILDFFIAGSQTTSLTIELGLITLALRLDIQQQLYAEVTKSGNNIDKGHFPHLHMKCMYPLMEAFIMEVQRFYHIFPIIGPRRALNNTTLGGYSIPENTIAFIGLRSILMNTEHWIDPEVFRLERFINTKGEILKNEYFMPFGQGRRRCLGDALARACIFSFLVKIIQNFQIELTDSPDERPSTELLPGIILTPKPYKVRFIKRV